MSDEISASDKKVLLDHSYDGIQELDYNLPRWWLWLFWITIVFGVLYSGYYLTGMGPTLRAEMNEELAELQARRAAAPQPTGAGDEALIIASLHNPEKLKHGSEVFAGKCMPCHGDKGQGVIGPNLTDDFWIHGTGAPGDIAKVVREGVSDKGMPPWGPVLSADELIDVVAYVRSIHGTNPAGAKEPQGEKHDWQNL